MIIEGLKSQSPYASMDNNPIRLDDPDGDCPPCIAQIPVESVLEEAEEVGPEIWHAVGGIAAGSAAWVSAHGGPLPNSSFGLSSLADIAAQNAAPAPTMTLSPSDQAALNKLNSWMLPPKAPTATAPTSTNVVNAKKGPKDLVGEAKAQQQKEAQAAERAAKRKAATVEGKAKEGNSNQVVRGDHNTGAKRGDKHSKRIERGLREQKAADAAKEAAKKKKN